jgi:hypothetical protein
MARKAKRTGVVILAAAYSVTESRSYSDGLVNIPLEVLREQKCTFVTVIAKVSRALFHTTAGVFASFI